MNVVVTGATGFVGGALARALVGEGHAVVGLQRPSAQTAHMDDLAITWRSGDVTRPESLDAAFMDADCVVHAAGMLGQAGVPEKAYFDLHERGTDNVLAAAANAGVQRLLYVSSPGVLGPVSGMPAKETAPLAPSNPYERSKAAAEKVAHRYARSGLPLVIARPEFIYGPGYRHVLGLFRAVRDGRFFYIGGGNNTCHPTYIADAVAGMLLCLEQGRLGEIYHVTGPAPVTFRELGAAIADALGAEPPRVNLPRPLAWLGAGGLEAAGRILSKTPPLSRTGVAFFSENRRFSWEKARRELGYEPAFDLQAGVQRTVTWYQEQGWL